MVRPLSLVCLVASSLLALPASGQQAATQAELSSALAGRWTGVLEYRDYQEPASSQKRVTLPTWLLVETSGQTETWHYVYDDGPGKVVDEDEQILFDAEHERCTITSKGKAAQPFRMAGYQALRSGHGTLVLSGAGTDSGRPSERRITLTVDRNLLTLLEEVRPAGTQEGFAYRHLYRLVRAEPPVATASR